MNEIEYLRSLVPLLQQLDQQNTKIIAALKESLQEKDEIIRLQKEIIELHKQTQQKILDRVRGL